MNYTRSWHRRSEVLARKHAAPVFVLCALPLASTAGGGQWECDWSTQFFRSSDDEASRLNTSSAAGTSLFQPPTGLGLDGDASKAIRFDSPKGARILVSGNFQAAGGQTAPGFASFDGVTWTALTRLSTHSYVTGWTCSTIADKAVVFAIGQFEFPSSAGGTSACATWDGEEWRRIPSPSRSEIRTVANGGTPEAPRIYVAGVFDLPGPPRRSEAIAEFDGTTWRIIGEVTYSGVISTMGWIDTPSGGFLAVVGTFNSINHVPITGGPEYANTAMWDESGWRSLELEGVPTSDPPRGCSRGEFSRWIRWNWTVAPGTSGPQTDYIFQYFFDHDHPNDGPIIAGTFNLPRRADIMVPAVARWRDGQWRLLARSDYLNPHAVAVLHGQPYFFGPFQQVNHIPSSGVARLDCTARICPFDLDGDGSTNAGDVAMIIQQWSQVAIGDRSDIDQDGVVTIADLAELITHWNELCP